MKRRKKEKPRKSATRDGFRGLPFLPAFRGSFLYLCVHPQTHTLTYAHIYIHVYTLVRINVSEGVVYEIDALRASRSHNQTKKTYLCCTFPRRACDKPHLQKRHDDVKNMTSTHCKRASRPSDPNLTLTKETWNKLSFQKDMGPLERHRRQQGWVFPIETPPLNEST